MATATTEAIRSLLGDTTQRDETRAKYRKRLGFDPCISEETAEQIARVILRGWVIQQVEFTGVRLTFHVMPKTDVWSRVRLDIEDELSRTFGNRPYALATDFGMYRKTFIAN